MTLIMLRSSQRMGTLLAAILRKSRSVMNSWPTSPSSLTGRPGRTPAAAMADSFYGAGENASSGFGSYSWSVGSYGGDWGSFYGSSWDAASGYGAASGYVYSGAN